MIRLNATANVLRGYVTYVLGRDRGFSTLRREPARVQAPEASIDLRADGSMFLAGAKFSNSRTIVSCSGSNGKAQIRSTGPLRRRRRTASRAWNDVDRSVEGARNFHVDDQRHDEASMGDRARRGHGTGALGRPHGGEFRRRRWWAGAGTVQLCSNAPFL